MMHVMASRRSTIARNGRDEMVDGVIVAIGARHTKRKACLLQKIVARAEKHRTGNVYLADKGCETRIRVSNGS
jgi:hypothetical protein